MLNSKYLQDFNDPKRLLSLKMKVKITTLNARKTMQESLVYITISAGNYTNRFFNFTIFTGM